MHLGLKIIPVKNYRGRGHKTGRKILCSCDICDAIFTKPFFKSNFLNHGKNDFCSRDCQTVAKQKGNLTDVFRRKLSKEKNGFEHNFQSPEVVEIARKRCIETLIGVNSPFKRHDVKEKIKQTHVLRHGVEHCSQIPEVKLKKIETFQKRWGVAFGLQNKEIFEKANRSRWNRTHLQHWKTCKELICTASYEKAFVEWCNANQIDFDWQIPHKMPDGRIYYIDAFIKTGEFASTWIEIKGWFPENRREKWEWFHANHLSDSQLWTQSVLRKFEILK